MIETQTDDRGVATITIARPERRNALDREAMLALRQVLLRLEADARTRAVLVRGSGGTFSAGRDLKEAAGLDANAAQQQHTAWTDVFRVLRRLTFPSVAVVEGYAVAGGFTLAMGCDFVLAEREAQFGAMEMQNGFPAAVCAPIMARLAGARVGLELVLFGALASAERLYGIGLVNTLADGSEALEAEAAALVQRLLALDPLAVRQTLETFRAAETMPIDQALTMGQHLNQLLDASGSFRRGGQSFAERQDQRSG